MPIPKRSMTVELRYTGQGDGVCYYVTQAVNSTNIPVDSTITKSEVDQLIQGGVQVTVKAPKGK